MKFDMTGYPYPPTREIEGTTLVRWWRGSRSIRCRAIWWSRKTLQFTDDSTPLASFHRKLHSPGGLECLFRRACRR